jgi:hypothetical protein
MWSSQRLGNPIFSIDNPVPMIDMKHPPQIKGGGG